MNFYNTNDVCITINSIPYKNFFIISPLQQENNSIQNWMIKDCKYPFTYVVGENDTLIKISEKFNIPVLKLSKLNNIKNPNFINKDEVLQIYSNGIYSLKKNDSLNKIIVQIFPINSFINSCGIFLFLSFFFLLIIPKYNLFLLGIIIQQKIIIRKNNK